MKKIAYWLYIPGIYLLILLATSSTYAQNLITNGNFSAGNTGFSTALTYVAPTDTPTGYLQPDGRYTIAKNPASHDNTVTGIDAHKNPEITASFTDHTGDAAGNMLLINANTASGNETAWQQNITSLAAGGIYNFSASIAYWGLPFDAPHTKIRFAILTSGTSATSYANYLATSSSFPPPQPTTSTVVPAVAASLTGVWNTYSFTWTNTTNASDVVVRIESVDAIGGGFDYAIDDIALVAVPEPSTFTIFGSMGLIGFIVFKRRRVA